LGYDAIALGSSDLMYGRAFLEKHGAGLLFVSNLRWKNHNSPLTITRKIINRGQQTFEVFGIIFPEDVYTGEQADIEVDDPSVFLQRHCQPGFPTIVLCATSNERARTLVSLPQVEVVINATPTDNILDQPQYQFTDGRVFAEGALYGSRIGVLRAHWANGRLAQVANEFVELNNEIADGERVREYFEEYEAATKKLFLAQLAGRPAFDTEASPYAGSQSCARCHQEAFAVWQSSRHANAWASLKKVNKQFDSECISCHVIGYGSEGGFHSEQESPQLLNVGCEACHGPGKKHISNQRNELESFTLRNCIRCHNAERSPNFKTTKAWVKIRH